MAALRRGFSSVAPGVRRRRSLMIFASEVPVISALNPYRAIEDVFLTTWKRTQPKQVAALQQQLQVTVTTPEEKMQAVVQELGATPAIDALLKEAAAAETTTHVAAATAKIAQALPESTPAAVKQEVVQFVASEMNKGFGAKQEAPAILHYEKQQKVAVQERNLAFFKKRVASNGAYDIFVGGKIDGRADGKVIEVKNRVSRFLTPLPKYDVAQLQTYLFILGAKDGELVEHLRGDVAQAKLTEVPWDEEMWQHEIAPYVVRFSNALVHFMKDTDAQMQFLQGDASQQKEIIRSHWLMDVGGQTFT